MEYLGEGGWSTWERGVGVTGRGVGVPVERGVGVPGRGVGKEDVSSGNGGTMVRKVTLAMCAN